jgi:hypothetical protein
MFASNVCFTLPNPGGSPPPITKAAFKSFAIDSQPTLLLAGEKVIGGIRSFKWTFINDGIVLDNTFDIADQNTGTNIVTDGPKASPQNYDIGPDIQGATGDTHSWRA